MSRHRRWRRGFGALAGPFAALARCRLLRSLIGRAATVRSDLKKTVQLDDSTHNYPVATTAATCRRPLGQPAPPARGSGHGRDPDRPVAAMAAPQVVSSGLSRAPFLRAPDAPACRPRR